MRTTPGFVLSADGSAIERRMREGHVVDASVPLEKSVTAQAGVANGVGVAGGVTVGKVRRGDPSVPRYAPASPIHASELQATSVAEFLDLLRELLKRSGVNRKRIAERSGIPQSTVYHLLNPKTTTLPTKVAQVRALVAACGLAPTEVERVIRLWVELRDLPAVAVADDDELADGVDVDQAVAGADQAVAGADQAAARPARRRMGRIAARMRRKAEIAPEMFLIPALLALGLGLLLANVLVNDARDVPGVSAGICAAVMTVAWKFGRRYMGKPKIVVVEQYVHPNGAIATSERCEYPDGRVTYTDRTVHPDGRVNFSTREG